MTYNFDIDRWYEIRLAYLESRRRQGKVSPEQYLAEKSDLERRCDDMRRRLDRSFQIPTASKGAADP